MNTFENNPDIESTRPPRTSLDEDTLRGASLRAGEIGSQPNGMNRQVSPGSVPRWNIDPRDRQEPTAQEIPIVLPRTGERTLVSDGNIGPIPRLEGHRLVTPPQVIEQPEAEAAPKPTPTDLLPQRGETILEREQRIGRIQRYLAEQATTS